MHCTLYREKCNSIPNCLDQSDELNCEFAKVGGTYLRSIVPRGREPGVRPMEVRLSAMIISIVNVDTTDLKFTLDFALTAEWYDERLQYRDLNDKESLNSMVEEEFQDLWTPLIMMQNALGWWPILFATTLSNLPLM